MRRLPSLLLLTTTLVLLAACQRSAPTTSQDAMTVHTPTPFELAFLDPPYRKNLIAPALTALRDGWLAKNALVVAECGEDESIETDFRLLDERTYGDTRVMFLTPPE